MTSSLFANGSMNLPLMGEGQYKWMFLKIYDAKLWGISGPELYSSPLILELKYRRDFSGIDIVDQSIKELKKSTLSNLELDQLKNKLLEIFPDVKEGDVIQAYFDPMKGLLFKLNSQKELGRLADVSFSKKFLDIWLGEKTSAPDLRKKLLNI